MELRLTALSKKRTPADLLVIGYFEGSPLSKEAEALEPDFVPSVKAALERKRFSGKFGETVSAYCVELKEAAETVVLGLGKKPNHKHFCIRKAAATVVQLAQSRKAQHVRVLLDSFVGGDVTAQDAASAFSEIALLSTYVFDKYKTPPKDEDKKRKLETVELIVTKSGAEAALKKSIEWARLVAEGTVMARNLIKTRTIGPSGSGDV